MTSYMTEMTNKKIEKRRHVLPCRMYRHETNRTVRLSILTANPQLITCRTEGSEIQVVDAIGNWKASTLFTGNRSKVELTTVTDRHHHHFIVINDLTERKTIHVKKNC